MTFLMFCFVQASAHCKTQGACDGRKYGIITNTLYLCVCVWKGRLGETAKEVVGEGHW